MMLDAGEPPPPAGAHPEFMASAGLRCARQSAALLQSDALGEKLPVIGRIAKHELRALGPLEVQVSWMFPGEADAAVDLNVLSRSVEVGL